MNKVALTFYGDALEQHDREVRQAVLREVRDKRGEILNSFPPHVPVDTLQAWKAETKWLKEEIKEEE